MGGDVTMDAKCLGCGQRSNMEGPKQALWLSLSVQEKLKTNTYKMKKAILTDRQP